MSRPPPPQPRNDRPPPPNAGHHHHHPPPSRPQGPPPPPAGPSGPPPHGHQGGPPQYPNFPPSPRGPPPPAQHGHHHHHRPAHPQGPSPPPHGHSFPPQGFPPQSFPPQSFPPQSFPPQSFPPQGFPPQAPPTRAPSPPPAFLGATNGALVPTVGTVDDFNNFGLYGGYGGFYGASPFTNYGLPSIPAYSPAITPAGYQGRTFQDSWSPFQPQIAAPVAAPTLFNHAPNFGASYQSPFIGAQGVPSYYGQQFYGGHPTVSAGQVLQGATISQGYSGQANVLGVDPQLFGGFGGQLTGQVAAPINFGGYSAPQQYGFGGQFGSPFNGGLPAGGQYGGYPLVF